MEKDTPQQAPMLPAEALTKCLGSLDLKTPRLRLRLTTADDQEVQIEHEMMPAIMWAIRDPQPQTEVEQRVRDLGAPWSADEGSWISLSLEDLKTQAVIGFFFLNVISHENQSVELGYRLHPDYWRRGYTFEAAQCLLTYCREILRVRKVVAYCISANEGSAGLLEKLGFIKEGCLRQHSALSGQWPDELVYGLILAPQREAPQ